MMYTLGLYGIQDTNLYGTIPVYTHDHNLALMKNGEVIDYIAIERITRRKYDNSLPQKIDEILRYLIKKHHIDIKGLRIASVNSFMGNSLISTDGTLRIEPVEDVGLGDKIIYKAKGSYYRDGYFLGIKENSVESYIVPHELAHIGSVLPFVGKFKENSLLVHIDGGASDSKISVWHYVDGKIEHVYHSWKFDEIQRFHANHLIHEILGSKELYFKGHYLSIPGKLMGYAAYGEYNKRVAEFLKKHNYFDNLWNMNVNFFKLLYDDLGISLDKFDNREKFFKDIAAVIQKDFENAVLEKLSEFKDKTGAEYLYYAGGGALNIITNVKIVNSGLFKEVHIPPCTNDSGLGLGAAALLEFLKLGKVKKHTPFLNSLYLDRHNKGSTISVPDSVVERICYDISKGLVVGVCIGYGEIGPRALGHRSIIGKPDDKSIKMRISENIKRREWYRPVAVSMLKEIAEKVSEENIDYSELWRYMLGAYHIREEYRDKFSGSIHVDGTIRIHAVSKNDAELGYFYKILNTLYSKYDIWGVINTSFNIRGEPIIHDCSKDNILEYSRSIGLDAVLTPQGYFYMGGKNE